MSSSEASMADPNHSKGENVGKTQAQDSDPV